MSCVPVVAGVLGATLFFGYLFAWFHAGAFFSGDGKYRRGAGEATFQVEFPAIYVSRPRKSTDDCESTRVLCLRP